jgi:hypothetical protein
MTLTVHVWLVALALAACAPWLVRVYADALESRVRRRTEALVARARARVPTPAGNAEGGPGAGG